MDQPRINQKNVFTFVLKVIIGVLIIADIDIGPYDDFQYDSKNTFCVYPDLVDPFCYVSL